LQEPDTQLVDAIARADLDHAQLASAEHALLEFARKLTLQPHQIAAEDLQRLRDCGWTDAQLAEAVYVVAMFAFFNRVADAFGLADPQYRELGTNPASRDQ